MRPVSTEWSCCRFRGVSAGTAAGTDESSFAMAQRCSYASHPRVSIELRRTPAAHHVEYSRPVKHQPANPVPACRFCGNNLDDHLPGRKGSQRQGTNPLGPMPATLPLTVFPPVRHRDAAMGQVPGPPNGKPKEWVGIAVNVEFRFVQLLRARSPTHTGFNPKSCRDQSIGWPCRPSEQGPMDDRRRLRNRTYAEPDRNQTSRLCRLNLPSTFDEAFIAMQETPKRRSPTFRKEMARTLDWLRAPMAEVEAAYGRAISLMPQEERFVRELEQVRGRRQSRRPKRR